jgi:hypothetical protein
MSKNDKNDKINNLQEEFNKIQEDNKDLDVNMYLAKVDDLPEFGEIEIYDYNADVVESKDRAEEVLNSLLDLYLGDLPSVKQHSYIKNKVKEDALNYAETLFLIKMTRKTFISQMRQVDNGDNNARMYEVMNQTMTQMRDNIKFNTSVKSDLEKFYKDIRKDMGANEVQSQADEDIKQDDEQDDSMVVDSRKMNEMLLKHLKNKS